MIALRRGRASAPPDTEREEDVATILLFSGINLTGSLDLVPDHQDRSSSFDLSLSLIHISEPTRPY